MSVRIAANERPVVVLGAGLTGMSAALALSDRQIDHLIFEKQAHVGGLASTILDGDYRFDHTGHLLHLSDPTRHARILSLLDEPPLEIERRSLIYSEGVYTRYPYQSNTHGLPAETAYHCLLDFVRANTVPTKPAAHNFEEYCIIHFGRAIAERFMLPYNRRLWGVEPAEITTSWCERFVPIPSLEDVLAGAVGHPQRELGYNATGLYPRAGIGELSSALGRQLTSLMLRTSARRIDVRERRVHFDHSSMGYRALISTLPLTVLLSLMTDVPDSVSSAGRQLRCAPLYYLDVALRHQPCIDMHWVYVPEDRFPFYRVGNYAAFSPQMAPPGAASLYLELVERSVAPELDRIWPATEAALLEMRLIRRPEDVAFCRVRRIDHAYVIYDQKREAALATILAYLEPLGILSVGRYGGWNYSSMQDALEFGEQAVKCAQEKYL